MHHISAVLAKAAEHYLRITKSWNRCSFSRTRDVSRMHNWRSRTSTLSDCCRIETRRTSIQTVLTPTNSTQNRLKDRYSQAIYSGVSWWCKTRDKANQCWLQSKISVTLTGGTHQVVPKVLAVIKIVPLAQQMTTIPWKQGTLSQ